MRTGPNNFPGLVDHPFYLSQVEIVTVETLPIWKLFCCLRDWKYDLETEKRKFTGPE